MTNRDSKTGRFTAGQRLADYIEKSPDFPDHELADNIERGRRKKGTPMVVSTKSQTYDFPPLCKGKHKFGYAMMTIVFEDEGPEYFPVKYGNVCVRCAEPERP